MRAITPLRRLGTIALAAAVLAVSGCVEIPLDAADGSFERTLAVGEQPQIDITTGSGSI